MSEERELGKGRKRRHHGVMGFFAPSFVIFVVPGKCSRVFFTRWINKVWIQFQTG